MVSRAVLAAIAVLALPMICVGQQELADALSAAQQGKMQQIVAAQDAQTFLSLAEEFWGVERHGLSQSVKDAAKKTIGERAKQLLLDPAIRASIDSDLLLALQGWAKPTLGPQEIEDLREPLRKALENVTLLSLEELQSQVQLLQNLLDGGYDSREEISRAVSAWLMNQDVGELSKAHLAWCFRHIARSTKVAQGFTVTWTGFIEPPRSGEYVLSIGPWLLSTQQIEDGQLVENKHSLTLQINGETVINATPEQWVTSSKTIELAAGKKVPIRVEYKNSWANDHQRLCPVVLYWEGPGHAKSVIPGSAFTAGDDGTAGLLANYSWQEYLNGALQQRNVREMDPNIDFFWADFLTIGARDEAMRKLAKEYISRWTGAEGDFVGDVVRMPQLMALLTSGQLTECLESLVSQPEQLKEISVQRMERFYYATRCGADEVAVDVLGTWMLSRPHTDTSAAFASNAADYFDLNREFHYRNSERLVYENKDRMQWLEERYLTTEDGDCCLSTATALAECHLVLGTIPDWIEKIKAKLADKTLTGNSRVKWLIARASAEELRQVSANRYYRVPDQLGAGKDWLVEAELVAESAEQQLWIAKESLSRLVAQNRWLAVEERLKRIEGQAGGNAEIVGAWRREIDKLKQGTSTEQSEAKLAIQTAYQNELSRRRAKAEARGDRKAVDRYDEILSKTSEAIR